MSLPVVAIVGRPNVGKSSLFNRFLKRKLAVVDPVSGVTRDRNYARCDWGGRDFHLVDTGGMVPDTRDLMERMILDQAEFAIHEADLIVFVVDVQVGVDQDDERLARRLHKSGKPCVLVANKSDKEQHDIDAYPFVRLGLGEAWPVSATVGLGIGELLDEIVAKLPPEEVDEFAEGAVRVALVGRPNVGKSSFINKLLGEDRLIVSTSPVRPVTLLIRPLNLRGRSIFWLTRRGCAANTRLPKTSSSTPTCELNARLRTAMWQ
ncbi:MAG: 50S ribosome-binding GTPase [candidate division Zixibacteria bacterium]|nr:50S ribosome-binding GTPase [candidate division Zixibacteria bacterium]